MTKVYLKGLGLIGSSLARAIKKKHPDYMLIAEDQNKDAERYALEHGIADECGTAFDKAGDADLIILATPVSVIEEDLLRLAGLETKPGAIITDVGSTKKTVMEAARKLIDAGRIFIAGHPMAGSHKTGVWAGKADLFENAFYFLIPADDASGKKLPELKEMLSGVHAKWLETTPDRHDRIVAQISHVPHVVASALVNQTERTFEDEPMGMRVAAGGFKSITRIASADPTMWSSILLNNGELISAQLEDYIAALREIDEKIKKQDQKALFDFFKSAKTGRDSLGPEKLGAIPGFYDLFINLADKVGSLADVTRILADARINLVNIHILEIREEIDGIAQLTFSSGKDRQKALELLKTKYKIIER
ncbi:prephenate dehydrogenase [Ligilactobacillus sp.]|uniref:prephenate dehydrogenase n=1 Tax=Ligilactobacillus sp. TaxID=2767921 RepID=UPI002FDF4304